MDYEKKYKEAMEKFKNFKDKYCTGGDLGFGDIIFDKSGKAQEEFDNIFPELKESKDEKIRKEIIDYIKTGTYKKDWIAWLEKQGKKKQIRQQCADFYNKDDELQMPRLTAFENELANILFDREYDGSTETEDDIQRGKLEYELAAIRLAPKLQSLINIEQKPESITDEWIEDYWQHHKVNNPYSYNKGDEIQFDHQGFVRFCKKYCKKSAWNLEELIKVADKYYDEVLIGQCKMDEETAHHCRLAYLQGLQLYIKLKEE